MTSKINCIFVLALCAWVIAYAIFALAAWLII